MIFAVETLLQCLDEIKPLLEQHWLEIARDRDIVKLDPDFIRYAQMNERGNLLIVTARDDGVIVGYADFFLGPQIHYRGTQWAESDIYWLRPDYRGAGHGDAMMAFAERELAARGVTIVHVRAKDAHPSAGRMWQRRGLEPIETVYAKVLKPAEQ